jgi:hypothetical protein
MSEIQSLTSRVQDLDRSVNFWNAAIIWVLAFTAIAATGLVITQYIAVRCAQQLAGAQSDLIRAKDAQLARDLGEKDVQIEDAKRAASEANRIAESERLALVKLEERFAWRRISSREHDALVSKLKPHAGAVVGLI